MSELTLTWEGERAPFAKAFIAAQKATEAVKKAATNPAFKSKYADLSEVVEAVIPALNAAGIGVIQSPAYDGDLVSMTTVLLHETGAAVTGVLHMRPTRPDPQGIGSVCTYMRRYSLLAMTGAAPEDDDGNSASAPAPANAAAFITEEQAATIQALIEDVGADTAKFLAYLKAPSLARIPAALYENAVAKLNQKRAA